MLATGELSERNQLVDEDALAAAEATGDKWALKLRKKDHAAVEAAADVHEEENDEPEIQTDAESSVVMLKASREQKERRERDRDQRLRSGCEDWKRPPKRSDMPDMQDDDAGDEPVLIGTVEEIRLPHHLHEFLELHDGKIHDMHLHEGDHGKSTEAVYQEVKKRSSHAARTQKEQKRALVAPFLEVLRVNERKIARENGYAQSSVLLLLPSLSCHCHHCHHCHHSRANFHPPYPPNPPLTSTDTSKCSCGRHGR